MSISYYLIGHLSLLAFLGQKISATLVGALVGLPAGWLIARAKLLPAWLAHFGQLQELLDPKTPSGIGAHTQQLAEISRKLDDLAPSPRAD